MLTINVGLAKKIGLPDYGSLGAHCNVEFAIDGSLNDTDLDRFHDQVRRAYGACPQAVNDELSRQQNPTAEVTGQASQPGSNGHGANGQSANGNGSRRSNARRATASQVRAIHTIAERNGVELADTLQSRFGVTHAEDLSITEASSLIDELKAPANGSGQGGRR